MKTIQAHGWDDMPKATQKALITMAHAVVDFAESPKWWISWEATDLAFEIHTPWWTSGVSDNADMICAAVFAETEEDAKRYVINSHDNPPSDLKWRFCFEKPKDWQPFSGRFPRRDWMKWI